jgi:NADPH:quinone reductase-like Zn-dependent oxidoreductase
MVSAIRFIQFGTPEVLNLQTLSEQSPGQGEVWLEQEAVGVNDAGILGVYLVRPSARFPGAVVVAFKQWIESKFSPAPPWVI